MVMRTITENCGAWEQGVARQMSPDQGVRESRSWSEIWRRRRSPGTTVSRVGGGGGICSHPHGSMCILPCSFWELIFSLWLGNAYMAVKKPQNYVFLHLLRLALSPHSLSTYPSLSWSNSTQPAYLIQLMWDAELHRREVHWNTLQALCNVPGVL